MKILFTLLLILGAAIAAPAQGTLNFSNGAAGVNAPASYTLDGTRLGPDYVADLYIGAQGSSANSLTAAGFNVAFSSGVNAGYFFGGARVVNGFAAGQTITAQVRVWRLAAGPTYEAALFHPHGDNGVSTLIQITLGGGPTPTPSLVGLQPFSAGPLSPPVAPEPSTFVLGSLGIGMLLTVRRRNSKCIVQ